MIQKNAVRSLDIFGISRVHHHQNERQGTSLRGFGTTTIGCSSCISPCSGQYLSLA